MHTIRKRLEFPSFSAALSPIVFLLIGYHRESNIYRLTGDVLGFAGWRLYISGSGGK